MIRGLQNMVAATQTQIQIQKGTSSSGGGVQGNGNTHGILKLRSPTCPTSSHASRLIAPIPLSGAFARRGIRYSDSTPAIGTEFARGSLDLAQLLNEDDNIQQRELLKELASLGKSQICGVFFGYFCFPARCPLPPKYHTLQHEY